MLQVAFFDVKPDKINRLRSWMEEVQTRRDEVIETFRQETVTHEVAYLLAGPKSPVLVYVMEVEDPDTGREAFRKSTLPIDREHKQVMDEVLGDKAEAELIHDIRID